eukprot:jgi/Tetstr1/453154/TSEL_040174.t1
MAEVTPCPFPDPGEACTVWRKQQQTDFARKAEQLGLHDDPAFRAMMAALVAENSELDRILEKQRADTSAAPWWADGEYDTAAADRSNDAGTAAFKAQDFSAAFDCFTEAIRLCPQKPVYHCNRAATALKLGREDIALRDAEYALERDPAYEKAMLKAGEACLSVGKSQQAASHFKALMVLNPGSKAAATGARKAAIKIIEDAKASSREEEERAQGGRPGLPLTLLPEKDAVELLYSAREMLRLHPDLEAARCGEVEALLHCQRLDDAMEEAQRLKAGVDGQYLQAECRWRSGDVTGALDMLRAALGTNPSSSKCTRLKCFLEGVLVLLEERARHLSEEHSYDAAKNDLSRASKLDPDSVETTMSLARSLGQLGLHEEAFFELCKVQKLNPKTPGLVEELQRAAACCQHMRRHGGHGNDDMANNAGRSDLGGLYGLLGVEPTAGAKAIKQAYHKLAGQWHPDKWAACEDRDQKKAAEAKFNQIKEAYDTLSDDRQRAVYDSTNLVV